MVSAVECTSTSVSAPRRYLPYTLAWQLDGLSACQIVSVGGLTVGCQTYDRLMIEWLLVRFQVRTLSGGYYLDG